VGRLATAVSGTVAQVLLAAGLFIAEEAETVRQQKTLSDPRARISAPGARESAPVVSHINKCRVSSASASPLPLR
jgi:hypothetical protein